MLAGLMGQISLPAMWPGDRFKFGYNVGYFSLPFIVENVATLLENEGITYNTRSYYLAGTLNAFIAVEGASNVYWNSATDLREAIFDLIKGAGYPIQTGSVQFEAETHAAETEPPTVVKQDDPGVTREPGGATPRGPAGDCDGLNLPDWVACKLGVTTSSAVVLGAVVGIGALLLIRGR